MDQNEVVKGFLYRHPWELSRTKKVIGTFSKFLKDVDARSEGKPVKYINVGSGDCFFDLELKHKFKHQTHAVDIGYKGEYLTNDAEHDILRYDSFDKLPAENDFDYAVMMDSLEYMPDDAEYLRMLASKLKKGGYIFLTLPANKSVFSSHDSLVGNLRRYDTKDIKAISEACSDIFEPVYIRKFYLSLLIVRRLELLFGMKVSKDEKITTGWMHAENSLATRLVCLVLNIDYSVCTALHFNGLSAIAIFKKK